VAEDDHGSPNTITIGDEALFKKLISGVAFLAALSVLSPAVAETVQLTVMVSGQEDRRILLHPEATCPAACAKYKGTDTGQGVSFYEGKTYCLCLVDRSNLPTPKN
jgi:hypothetical protein